MRFARLPLCAVGATYERALSVPTLVPSGGPGLSRPGSAPDNGLVAEVEPERFEEGPADPASLEIAPNGNMTVFASGADTGVNSLTSSRLWATVARPGAAMSSRRFRDCLANPEDRRPGSRPYGT